MNDAEQVIINALLIGLGDVVQNSAEKGFIGTTNYCKHCMGYNVGPQGQGPIIHLTKCPIVAIQHLLDEYRHDMEKEGQV